MNKIAVIVDSSSYIPSELREKYDIYEVPVPIIFGGKIKFDTDWKTPAKFFADMNSSKELPTTSQASPADALKTFDQVKNDGYEQAIFITMSSGISGLHNTIVNMANQYTDMEITVWDSRVTVMAAGIQALLAAELIQKGKGMDEILEKLEILRSSTDIYLVVDDINHLKRTGRLSGGISLAAGLLSIKPILTFNEEGKIDAIAKERQMKRAWAWIEKRVVEYLKNQKLPVRAIVVDANNEEGAQGWVDGLKAIDSNMPIDRGILGSLIAVHTGERAVGLVLSVDWKYLAEN